MRVGTYDITAVPGDKEGGQCAVYYFGPGQGGTIDANVTRWMGQMRHPSGGSVEDVTTRKDTIVDGISVTRLDIQGTFLYSPSPMSPQKTPKPDYRMLAAIVGAPGGPVFFKLTAPAKTAAQAKTHLDALVASVTKN